VQYSNARHLKQAYLGYSGWTSRCPFPDHEYSTVQYSTVQYSTEQCRGRRVYLGYLGGLPAARLPDHDGGGVALEKVQEGAPVLGHGELVPLGGSSLIWGANSTVQ